MRIHALNRFTGVDIWILFTFVVMLGGAVLLVAGAAAIPPEPIAMSPRVRRADV
jgi:hypothetical protein